MQNVINGLDKKYAVKSTDSDWTAFIKDAQAYAINMKTTPEEIAETARLLDITTDIAEQLLRRTSQEQRDKNLKRLQDLIDREPKEKKKQRKALR